MKHILILPDGSRLSSGADAPSAIKSVTLTQSVNDGAQLTPGSAVAAELEVSVFAPGGGLHITAGQEVRLLRTDGSGLEQPLGIFLLEKPTRTSPNTLRLTGLDRLVKLDKDLTDWTASLTGWPYPLLTFAQMVCEACGVTLITGEVPNGDYPISRISRSGVTGRQLIRWLGEIACRFCTANPEGQLEFGWYTDSGVRLAPTGDRYYFQNGLSYEDYTVAADAGSLPDNPLLGSHSAEAITRIQQELSGLTYTPCKVEVPAMPELRPGHIFTVTTPGGEITGLVMTRTAAPGKTTLECTGSARSSTADKSLHQLIREEADTAARNEVEAQTQADIFNKLTDNGAVKGVYMEDGQLYINASFIKSGQLAADLIRAGVLQSGDGSSFYLDLDNGILKGKFTEFTVSGQTVDAIAQEKADAARQSAAADATAKANAAQQSAISAAAADATNKANSALSSANGYTDSLNSLLDQQEVFNRLTANGTLPGLYMENGQLYINASYLKSGTVNADLVKAGVITSEDGSIKIDLVGNKIDIGEGTGTRPAWDSKIELDAFGIAGYGKHYSTGAFEKTLQIRPGLNYAAGNTILNAIKSLSGVGLSIGTDGGTFYLGDSSADTKIYGSSITVSGEMQTDSINPGKTRLFSGNVAMGNSCTVPNTGLYDLFAVKLGDSGTTYDTVVLAYKTGIVIRGVGGWAGTASQSKQLYFFSAALSGDTWTVEDAGVHNVYIGGTVEEGVRLNLKEIIGVI